LGDNIFLAFFCAGTLTVVRSIPIIRGNHPLDQLEVAMKNNQSLKMALGSILCLAIVALLLQTNVEAQGRVGEDIQRLKLKYEDAFKRYKTALTDGKNNIINDLANEVKLAKDRYEDAKRALTLSDEKQTKIKTNTKKISDKFKKAFSIGKKDDKEPVKGETKILPAYATMTVSINGNNYCGQYAMTAALRGMGISASGQDIYKDTNPAGIFTGPATIIEKLNMSGLDASTKHNASLKDLIKKIDEGKPALVLVDAGSAPHWVCIVGYKTDGEGNVTSIQMRDSYWGTRSVHSMEVGKFQKIWNKPLGNKVLGSIAGYSNLLIDIKDVKEADFSPPAYSSNFWTATEDNIAAGINDTVTGFKNLSPTQFVGGLTKSAIGVPAAVLGIASNGVNAVGSGLYNYGKSKWQEGGLGNKIFGGVAIAAGGVTKAAAFVGKTASNVVSSAATLLGNGIKKLGFVFAR
jgi:hypothetical protein